MLCVVVECPGNDTWGGLVAGGLPEVRRAAVVDHAAACERCHALIAALVDIGAPDDPSSALTSPGREPKTGGLFAVGRGVQIGRYVIEERLGAGGMGVVYDARDSELHRRVAVKLLRPGGPGHATGDARKRLLREARTLARLSHPNVVTVFDVGEDRGQLFVAMELVEGGSLKAWLRRTRRGPDEIIDRLLEAARGLAAAHQAGVVHRDIKPDNILVGTDGRARVTDFGLARPVDAHSWPGGASPRSITDAPCITLSGMLLGTPMYMAPEQLAGGDADARTDQWSFCMTLYEALAGVRPFAGADLAALVSATREGRLAPPVAGRRVPGWIRRIVMRGLRADPGERWPSIDAMVEALARGRNRWRWRSGAPRLPPARTRRHAGIAMTGLVVSIAGITTFAAIGGRASMSEAPVAPLAGSAATPATAPAIAATRRDDPAAVARARLHDAQPVSLRWSSAHAGAPCPSARDLTRSGDAHALDAPWGHADAITCTDQPADQVAGPVSTGPDGTLGTHDDLASWALAPYVTELAGGARWRPAVAPPPPRSTATASKRVPHAAEHAALSPSLPEPPPVVDDDGIPARRWGH